METSSRFLAIALRAGQLSWAGVDLFFVLSGFLIGGILIDARESPRFFKTFYLRRFYRIFPLYLATLTLFLFRHLPFQLLPGQLGKYSPLQIPWGAYLTLTQNFWMARLGWYGASAMAVTWSLAIEEQFYLAIPLLIRKIRPDHLVWTMAIIVAGAPLLRFILSRTFVTGNFACYVLMPCRADALCMGVLAASLVRRQGFWSLLIMKRTVLKAITGLFFVGVGFMSYCEWGQFSNAMVTLGYSWLAATFTCCLLLAVSNGSVPAVRALCRPGLMKLGTVAYCTYLIHFPLIQAGRRISGTLFPGNENVTWLIGGLLGVGASLVIATLSWKYFEKPLLRRGHEHTY